MPLSKLFPKRNSLKGKNVSRDSNSEVSLETDSKDTLSRNFSNNTCEENTSSNEQHQVENETKTVSDETINEDANSNREEISQIGKTQHKMKRKVIVSEETDAEELLKNKSRSLSFKESGTKPTVPRNRRRKCKSESVLSNSTDDEGFEDRVIQLREKDLEKVIGHFVDKLVRESIATAVRSVHVDTVYDDVILSVSRSQSESSDSSGYPETVLQTFHTDSVTDYADLRRIYTFEESQPEEEMLEIAGEGSDDMISEHSEFIQYFKRDSTAPRNALLQTDGGENIASQNKTFEILQDAENGETRVLEVEESPHPRAERWKEEGHQNPDAQLKRDKNRTFRMIPENMGKPDPDDGAVISLQCEENSVLTDALVEHEIFEETELEKEDEISDTESCRQVERMEVHATSEDIENIHQGNLTDVERPQDEREEQRKEMDGYHADCEESLSIHSLASESSCENVKDGHICPPSISGEDESKELCEKVSKIPESIENDLMTLSGDPFSPLLTPSPAAIDPSSDLGENLPEQKEATEEEKKVNWKVGYLHVKLPHKTRGKGHLKVWKKRCVAIQPDEFANDPANPCLVLSVYSGESGAARKHSASFWKSVSCHKALVYRSSSRTHKYAFTLSDDQGVVVHLSAESEALAQEWMVAIRAILWPPSPVMQLEKMLNGCQFEISIIDNDFSYRAGLLGAYGHLTITPRKLILVHPQQGYVVQEWYLNTVDKFQLVPQTRIEDVNKVLAMTTCSDSSTGRGDILIFCREAVGLLQAVASTIHSILMQHSKEEGGTYQKELEEIGHWLDLPQPQEDYYKVPPRQVKSLLDIPNFIFDKPIPPVSTVTDSKGSSMEPSLTPSTDDFLNCSVTSFVGGGGNIPGKSSDSELSDAYSPPRSPEVKVKTNT